VYGIVLDCPQCGQPTTAFLAFLPNGDPTWDQSRIVLCNTELALAVADAATTELTHIVNAVGRPAYTPSPDPDLVNRCFHCDHPLTGDDLAAEVRRSYLDGVVDHDAIPHPAAVPDFLTAILDSTQRHH
jgi:hypothetical protein